MGDGDWAGVWGNPHTHTCSSYVRLARSCFIFMSIPSFSSSRREKRDWNSASRSSCTLAEFALERHFGVEMARIGQSPCSNGETEARTWQPGSESPGHKQQ